MKIRLVSSDPHSPTRISHLYREWWGREIEVGNPQRPRAKHQCQTHTIWPIIGPREFLDLLAKYDLGRYVCAHQIAEETQCGEIAELHARTNG